MKKDLWIFLFLIGLVLFNWPFIIIFRENFTIYPFVVWLLLIIAIIVIGVFSDREERGE